MPVITKSQIRPRRLKAHFTNAEILALDGASIALAPPAAAGVGLATEFVQIFVNIVQPYAGLDPLIAIEIDDDFLPGTIVVDSGPFPNMTRLLTLVGQNTIAYPSQQLADSGVTSQSTPIVANSFPGGFVSAGVVFMFNNNGANVTGGDSANYMNVFIDYKLVNL